MSYKYILKDKIPVIENDREKWSMFMNGPNCVIEQTTFHINNTERLFISTIFLGVDRNYGSGKDIAVFETMVFELNAEGKRQRELPIYTRLYSTYQQAQDGHYETINKVMDDYCKPNWPDEIPSDLFDKGK